MDFTHQLLDHVAIEIEPIKHDEYIHFVLLNFCPQLGKLILSQGQAQIPHGLLVYFFYYIFIAFALTQKNYTNT